MPQFCTKLLLSGTNLRIQLEINTLSYTLSQLNVLSVHINKLMNKWFGFTLIHIYIQYNSSITHINHCTLSFCSIYASLNVKELHVYIPKASCWLTAAVINVPSKTWTWKSFFHKYRTYQSYFSCNMNSQCCSKFYSSVIPLWESRRTPVYLIERNGGDKGVLSDYWYVMFWAIFLSFYIEYPYIIVHYIYAIHICSVVKYISRDLICKYIFANICHYSVNYVIYWISRENEWSLIFYALVIFSLRWEETYCCKCFGLKVTMHDLEGIFFVDIF